MEENKNHLMYIVAIVAIVAILGLVVLIINVNKGSNTNNGASVSNLGAATGILSTGSTGGDIKPTYDNNGGQMFDRCYQCTVDQNTCEIRAWNNENICREECRMEFHPDEGEPNRHGYEGCCSVCETQRNNDVRVCWNLLRICQLYFCPKSPT
jgi:hypothetical protein